MSIRGRFRDGVDRIFTAFGDVPKTITYKLATGNAVYTVATGDSVTPTVSFSVKAFVVPVDDRTIDGNLIRVRDRQVFINRKEAEAASVLAGATFAPSEADQVTIDAVDWNVTRVKEDPAGALVILYCRVPD